MLVYPAAGWKRLPRGGSAVACGRDSVRDSGGLRWVEFVRGRPPGCSATETAGSTAINTGVHECAQCAVLVPLCVRGSCSSKQRSWVRAFGGRRVSNGFPGVGFAGRGLQVAGVLGPSSCEMKDVLRARVTDGRCEGGSECTVPHALARCLGIVPVLVDVAFAYPAAGWERRDGPGFGSGSCQGGGQWVFLPRPRRARVTDGRCEVDCGVGLRLGGLASFGGRELPVLRPNSWFPW